MSSPYDGQSATESTPGISGENTANGIGVSGVSSGPGPVLHGHNVFGPGVSGSCENGVGVSGQSTAASGVSGTSTTGYGVEAISTKSFGLYAQGNGGQAAVFSGDVGIGAFDAISQFNSGASLEVSGTGAKFSGTIATETHTDANVYLGVLSSTPRIIFGGSTTHEIDNAAGVLRFFRPGAVDAVIDSSGNVGIGTTTPGASLEVAGTGAKFSGPIATETHTDANVYVGVLSSTPRIIFGGSTTHEIDNSGGVLRFFRPGVVDMTIQSDGTVSVPGNVTVGGSQGVLEPDLKDNYRASCLTAIWMQASVTKAARVRPRFS